MARNLLQSVIQSGSGCSGSHGPFHVAARNWDCPSVVTVTLSLMPVWNSAVYIDGRVIVAKMKRKFSGAKKPAGDSK